MVRKQKAQKVQKLQLKSLLKAMAARRQLRAFDGASVAGRNRAVLTFNPLTMTLSEAMKEKKELFKKRSPWVRKSAFSGRIGVKSKSKGSYRERYVRVKKSNRNWTSWRLKKRHLQAFRTKDTVRNMGKRVLWRNFLEFQLALAADQYGYRGVDILEFYDQLVAQRRLERLLERQKADAAGVRSMFNKERYYKKNTLQYLRRGSFRRKIGEAGLGLKRLRQKLSGKQGRRALFARIKRSRGRSGLRFYLAHKKGNLKKVYNRYRRVKTVWGQRRGLNGRCYITQTRNNLFVVLMCDKSAKVLMELSAGKLGFKGAAKRTRLVAVQLGRRIGSHGYVKNYRKMTVYLRGRISMLVRGVVQGLRLEKMKIRRLVYVREIAHNGVRLRKSRRM